jgi:hypothetical protein
LKKLVQRVCGLNNKGGTGGQTLFAQPRSATVSPKETFLPAWSFAFGKTPEVNPHSGFTTA